MRRKLISYDAFKNITEGSLANAVAELVEAESIVAGLLDVNSVTLHCYDDSNVYYETDEGNYIHALYEFDGESLQLDHIEEVVLDVDTEIKSRRNIVREMIEALLDDDENTARDRFRTFGEGFMPKMKFTKGRKMKDAMAKRSSNDKSNLKNEETINIVQKSGAPNAAKSRAAKKGHSKNPSAAREGWKTRKKNKSKIDREHKSAGWKAADSKLASAKKTSDRARRDYKRYSENINMWDARAQRVLEYVDYVVNTPVILQQTNIKQDDVGNVVSATIPGTRLRNEGKLLSLRWDTLKTDVKTMREKAMKLYLDEQFQQLVSQIKRLNNLADDGDLHEKVNTLVGNYPSVLYLTQPELAYTVSEALGQINAKNYDDQICEFIAEGILRTAFLAYPERVERLNSLAESPRPREDEDAFEIFQSSIQEFFPKVDEQMAIEEQVFADLYEVYRDVRHVALQLEHDAVRAHANQYLERLERTLNGKDRPSIVLAEEAAAYLKLLSETNLGTSAWDVVKTPYRTTVGEHPHMQKLANWSYAPSRDLAVDGYGGTLPVSDGKNYRGGLEDKMRNKSWGNIGGNDTYPSISNPYIPKSGDYTLKYEPGVDKTTDQGLGQWGSGDTWPSMSNPYIPQAVKKHVNNDNKVDDVESKVGLKQTSDLNQNIS